MIGSIKIVGVQDDVPVARPAQRVRLDPARRSLVVEVNAKAVGTGKADDFKVGLSRTRYVKP